MPVNELSALPRAVVRILQATLPFQDSPAVIAIPCQTIEDPAKIDLAIADAAKTTGPIKPVLIAAIDPACGTWCELCVLDVEGTDPLVIAIDEAEIVHLL